MLTGILADLRVHDEFQPVALARDVLPLHPRLTAEAVKLVAQPHVWKVGQATIRPQTPSLQSDSTSTKVLF